MVKLLANIFGLLTVLEITARHSLAYPTDAVNKDFVISEQDSQADETHFAPEVSISSQADLGDKKAEFKLSLIPLVEKSAESVNLEIEGIPSKVMSLYDNSQKKLVDVTHPIPILDTTSEHEKYGNNGDMFDGISRAIVNGYEAFSNLINTLIQKPKELSRSISKGITAQLDVLGGKLVGL